MTIMSTRLSHWLHHRWGSMVTTSRHWRTSTLRPQAWVGCLLFRLARFQPILAIWHTTHNCKIHSVWQTCGTIQPGWGSICRRTCSFLSTMVLPQTMLEINEGRQTFFASEGLCLWWATLGQTVGMEEWSPRAVVSLASTVMVVSPSLSRWRKVRSIQRTALA